MTYEEAKAKAETTVYVYMTRPSIIEACECAGIETKQKNGKYKSRTFLEEKLIEYYAKKWSD